jgi:hypothetical protein
MRKAILNIMTLLYMLFPILESLYSSLYKILHNACLDDNLLISRAHLLHHLNNLLLLQHLSIDTQNTSTKAFLSPYMRSGDINALVK